MRQVVTSLRDLLASVVIGLDYEFVGCELRPQGRGSVLRVFIDSPRGINVDDCAKVSRQISAILDVEDPIKGNYTLEVSSPGIDRPLFDLEHFVQFTGHKVKLKLLVPLGNRRNIVGTLLKVEAMNIHLLVAEEELVVPFSDIERAKLVADIN
jgi:ribosome maturation factor RimP